MEIFGVVFANMTFGLMMCVLNARCIADILQYDQEYFRTFLLPAAASAVMGLACFGVYQLFHLITKSNTFSTILAIIVAVVVYAVLIMVLRAVSEEELYEFPMGGRLARLARMMRLL